MAFTGFGTQRPFSFGASTTSASTGFGSFGTTATSTNTGFGGFGTVATTPSTGFGGFGTTTSTGNTFGTLGSAPTSSAPSLFGGGFGSTAAKSATGFSSSAFGSSGFGTGTSTFGSAAPTFGSTAPTFGSTAPAFGSTAPTFGTNTLGTGTGLFGSTPAFGTGSTLGAGTSTFGTSCFGSGGFGAKPTGTTFGGFGSGLGTASAFGQQQQQPQQVQQGPASAQEALEAAIYNCQVFGDERDQVLAKWNELQALWGFGKAYYSANAPPLELTEQNPMCRFKAVGYSRLSGREDKDGVVALLFHKKEDEIKANQQQLTASLAGLLGNRPNLQVHIDSVEPVSDNKARVLIYVTDTGAGQLGGPPQPPGPGTRISASELANFLNTASPKAALTSAGCGSVAAVTKTTDQQLQMYLQTPPPGLHIRLWKQAQADNPDPENYIPVPMVGFAELKWRTQCQAKETSLQAGFLRQSNDKLAALRTRSAAAAARLQQLTSSLHTLRHTLLQVVCRQEIVSRAGSALSPEEEAARARLHELASQLAAPPLYNGRLNELLSAVRLQRSASGAANLDRYHLDPGAEEDMRQFLLLQQKGMSHLMDTVRADLAALNKIQEGMAHIAQRAN